MREQSIITMVERKLTAAGRWFHNVHGTAFGGKDGKPDILTNDANGTLVGIECKRPGEKPAVNQWRQAILLLKSGARCVVAYDDFDVVVMDEKGFPEQPIGGVVGESEFAIKPKQSKKTFEVILGI